MERIIAIDFDGTIAHSDYPKIIGIRKDAVKYINKLYDDGFGIVINTCRAGKEETRAKNFLDKHNVKYHYINTNFPHLIETYKIDCRKISADVYIDDRCLFELPEWKEIYNIIKSKFNEDGTRN